VRLDAPQFVTISPNNFIGDLDDKQHLESEIRKAHVICVVYSIEKADSFDRIPTYWLPYFRQLGVNVPVILIGNKIDLRGGEVTNEALEDEIVPIMNEFKVFLVLYRWVIYLRLVPGSRSLRRVLCEDVSQRF
jgi:GTPase SAR1 family protein